MNTHTRIGLRLVVFATATLVLMAAAFCLIQAAHADDTDSSTPTIPAAPPIPGPVLATGGANTSTNPGTSCTPRLGLRNAPSAPSAIFSWTTNGDAGWPFGWPGQVPFTPNTASPAVSCSR